MITIDDKIRDRNIKYNINRETYKISALSAGTIHEYEYLTDREILPSDQSTMKEEPRFTYSTLRNALEKQTKIFKDPARKQTLSWTTNSKQRPKIKSISNLFSKDVLAAEPIYKWTKI